MKMKNIIFFMIMFPLITLAQGTMIECPYLMQLDTLKGSVVTRDIWFNNDDNPSRSFIFTGIVDLDIYSIMKSGDAGSDSFTVDVWGLKNKKRQGNVTVRGVGVTETFAQDSTRLTTVVVDSTLQTLRLDTDFTNISLWDGIRIKFRQNGNDLDTVKVWTNLKIPYGW